MNVNDESDTKRKKYLLDIIISLRQDFIKIYTLIKWSSISKDVSKFIDLLNWFRLQEFNFEQLIYQLNSLTSYSGAKLPNSDIITSLEVLYHGRPKLPSYNFIQNEKISNEKVLEVLQDLNLVLMTRFALIDIPKKFQKYEVRDGRIYINVPNEFQISLTVGNDLIIDDDSDGKKLSNQILLKEGLQGLYDLLHRYSNSFKLYLIAKNFKDLLINSRWRNNFQINYTTGKSLIIVNYWSLHYLSKNFKSFIELGINHYNSNLSYRWFKNGRYDSDEELDKIFRIQSNSIDQLPSPTSRLNEEENDMVQPDGDEKHEEIPNDDVNVDLILNIVVNKHAELIMGMIFNKLLVKFSNDEVSMITPHQMLLKISPKKSTIFAINPLTGFFYFIDPTPVQNIATKIINSPPSVSNTKPFITELDMVNHIVDEIIKLRLQVFNKEINNKLTTTEWINNGIIKLNDYESTKLSNFFIDITNEDDEQKLDSNDEITKVQFYRRKNWPSSWFLINMVSGLINRSFWWVARIKSINGDWKIQWLEILKFSDDVSVLGVEAEQLDYDFFNRLSTLSSNLIIDHMILEELHSRNVKFIKINPSSTQAKEVFAHKFKIEFPEDPIQDKVEENGSVNTGLHADPLNYESMLLIYNNNELLPIYNSSTVFFLKIHLINNSKMFIKLFGKLRNLNIKNFVSTTDLNLKIDEEKNSFEIFNEIDLISFINTKESKKSLLLFDLIFNTLNKLNELIKILHQLTKNNIAILDNSMDNITIKLNADHPMDLVIKLPEQSNHSIQISTTTPTSTTTKSSWEISLILQFINKYLQEQDEGTTKSNIIGILKYLQDIITPVLQTKQTLIDVISTNTATNNNNNFRLANGLNKLYFDLVFINLNHFQFIYFINSNVSNSKKTQRDKITINVFLKSSSKIPLPTTTSSDGCGDLLMNISLKDNLNPKNVKFKKLFELIFKNINELLPNNNNNNNNGSSSTESSATPAVPVSKSIEDDLINFDIDDDEEEEQKEKEKQEKMKLEMEKKKKREVMIKLNYDYLISLNKLDPVMKSITNGFIQYLQHHID
ncbi:MED14 Mediator of RNA polymerase II transcription subunit 14 [Candida maltosa Xu316]